MPSRTVHLGGLAGFDSQRLQGGGTVHSAAATCVRQLARGPHRAEHHMGEVFRPNAQVNLRALDARVRLMFYIQASSAIEAHRGR